MCMLLSFKELIVFLACHLMEGCFVSGCCCRRRCCCCSSSSSWLLLLLFFLKECEGGKGGGGQFGAMLFRGLIFHHVRHLKEKSMLFQTSNPMEEQFFSRFLAEALTRLLSSARRVNELGSSWKTRMLHWLKQLLNCLLQINTFVVAAKFNSFRSIS